METFWATCSCLAGEKKGPRKGRGCDRVRQLSVAQPALDALRSWPEPPGPPSHPCLGFGSLRPQPRRGAAHLPPPPSYLLGASASCPSGSLSTGPVPADLGCGHLSRGLARRSHGGPAVPASRGPPCPGFPPEAQSALAPSPTTRPGGTRDVRPCAKGAGTTAHPCPRHQGRALPPLRVGAHMTPTSSGGTRPHAPNTSHFVTLPHTQEHPGPWAPGLPHPHSITPSSPLPLGLPSQAAPEAHPRPSQLWETSTARPSWAGGPTPALLPTDILESPLISLEGAAQPPCQAAAWLSCGVSPPAPHPWPGEKVWRRSPEPAPGSRSTPPPGPGHGGGGGGPSLGMKRAGPMGHLGTQEAQGTPKSTPRQRPVSPSLCLGNLKPPEAPGELLQDD